MHLVKGKNKTLFLLMFVFFQYPLTIAGAPSLIGTWQNKSADSSILLVFQSDNTLNFNGETLNYSLSPGVIRVMEDWPVDYTYSFIGKKLVITFPEGHQMQFTKLKKTKNNKQQSSSGNSSTGAIKSSGLAQQIAGKWWGFSGSTEKRIGLCPNGSFYDYSESSYSGKNNSWGVTNQNQGSGTWSIQGNYQSGIILVRYNNGNQMSIKYQQTGESGCLFFNGSKLCRNGYCN